jgi:uncharacterized phage protein gp47/JayE
MTRPQVDFETLLANAGAPTTDAKINAMLEAEVKAANSIISNNSAMSPFWKLYAAVVVTPALWLIKNLLTTHVLPAMFVATATKTYLELKAWEVDVTRKLANNTKGLVTFTKIATGADISINAGTLISTDNTLGKIYQLEVIADTVIPSAALSADVLCIAVEAGSAFNLAAGYYYIIDDIPGIASAVNNENWITDIGADDETDDELALRVRDKKAAAGNYHIDAVYRASIAEFAGIRSDQLFFEHNAPRGPGTANCYVMVDVGETPQSLIDKINSHINTDGNHGHGDDVQTFAIPSSQHDLECEYWYVQGITQTQVDELEQAIIARIRAAFRESDDYDITRTRPLTTFSFSILSAELHEQLPHLKSIRWITADIENGIDLPIINMLTVTNNGVQS